jgi:hypothetical protein
MVYLYPMGPLFSIDQVVPKVFHLQFQDRFELGAHFLRYQEYYESPKFRACDFDILTYVKWYVREHNGNFSYFNDWEGFNLPAEELLKCAAGVKDPNPYDRFMESVARWCISQGGYKVYLIGSTTGTKVQCLHHEIAHGLWYTNPDYRDDQISNIRLFCYRHQPLWEELDKWLRKSYASTVIDDEAQAYLATGLREVQIPYGCRSRFVKTFKEYAPKN